MTEFDKKVLLIEDNPTETLLIQKLLEKSDDRTDLEAVGSLTRGLACLTDVDYDAVLLDLNLPDSSGISTYAKVKSHSPTIPVIVLTATDDDDMAISTLRNGAQDYLLKNQLNLTLLERSIRYAIERKHTEDEIQKAYGELEQRVEERTRELRRTIEQLDQEIKERKQAEALLHDAQKELEERIKERTRALKEMNEKLSIQLAERTALAETLYANEQQFRALVTSIPGAVYRFNIDAEWTLEYISDAIEEITGYPASDFIKNRVRHYRSIIHPDDMDRVRDAIQMGPSPMASFTIEYRIIDSNQRIRWFVEKGQCVFNSERKAVWLDGAIFDESDRRFAEEELQKANMELVRLATIDGLTQIANRRQFDDCLAREWQRLTREKKPLALIMADIDYFKLFNDTYGHQEGDRCLHAVAQAISAVVKRPSDIPARYGGEEFAILLPHTDMTGAVTIAEQIRKEILRLEITHAQSDINDHLTLSLGVTSVVPDSGLTPEALILAADTALYQAKKQGRNRLISG